MAYIEMCRHNTKIEEKGNKFIIESDLKLNYSAYSNDSYTGFIIYESGELIAEVDNVGHFIFRNKDLRKKGEYGNGYGYGEYHKGRIKISDDEILLNGNKVGLISDGGDLFSWIGEMLRETKLIPYKPWERIDFDENLLDVDVALCLLFLTYSCGTL
jgi:hypothetical protein